MADQRTVAQGVADSIRCLAEYIARNADDYAVGMEYATGMTISMKFEINCIPEIVVTKNISPYSNHEVIKDERCYIWTRYIDKGDIYGDGKRT